MTMTLQELSDHEEIKQAVYTYFRGGDRLDAALACSACWDDAIYEGGPMDGRINEAIPQLFENILTKCFMITNHYMSNTWIDLRGDHAFAEVYGVAYHILSRDQAYLTAIIGAKKLAELSNVETQSYELTIGIRYSLRFEKRGETWKIAIMKLVIDWSRVVPYAGIETGGAYDFLTVRGTRDRSDPSYAWLS